jgi:hypothetical protein
LKRQLIILASLMLIGFLSGQRGIHLPFDHVQLNIGLIESELNAIAPITLTRIPTKFYTNRDSSSSGTVTIEWLQADKYGDLYYSRFPNVARAVNKNSIQDNANNDRSIHFNVGQEGITTGVYYCVIADRNNPDSTSIEFNLVIEHHLSPSNFTPTGEALSSDGYMQWQASHTYTPFYHVIVSDQKLRIEDIDDDPEYEVTGLNIVYQAITPNTSIGYRDADPSGFFDNTGSPGLASGKTYYWLVLNNYGNSPAMTSDVVTYLQAPSFRYSKSGTEQTKPLNLYPPDDAVIGQNDDLIFRWSSVDNAVYHLYLYEEREVEGNIASYLYYDTTLATGDTSFYLSQSGQILVNTNYNWNVTAENGQYYSASDLSTFEFAATGISTLEIKIRSDASGNPDLGRVNLDIRNINTPTSNIRYLTDESGYFEREVQSGTYRVTAKKESYFTGDTIISVASGLTHRLNMILRENATYFTGTVQIPDNAVIPSVNFRSAATGEQLSVFGQRKFAGENTSQYTFRANVVPGDWIIYPFAEGFRAATGDTLTSSIQLNDYLELPVLDLVAIGSNIVVNVTDNSGRPLNDVTLTFTRGNTQQIIYATDLPYIFPAEPGIWTVSAEKEGYFSQADQYEVEVVDKQDSPLDIIMIRAGYIIGTVYDDQRDVVVDATIEATPLDVNGRYNSSNSRADGTYGPLFVKPGQYRLSVSKTGYSEADTTVTIAALDSLRYNPIITQFTSRITGTVYDEENNPVSEARIVYRLEDGSGSSVLSAGDGAYELGVPSNVALSVFAQKTGYATSDTIPFTLSEGETVTQDFILHQLSAIIYGEVKTIEGGKLVGLAGASVTVKDPVSQVVIYSDQSDKEGSFTVYCDAGTVQVHVEKLYYTSQYTTLTVTADQPAYVQFILALQADVGLVSGSVKSSDNQPMADQEVMAIRKSTGGVVREKTDPSGNFSFATLLPGEIYTITTSKTRYITQPLEGYTIQVSFSATTGLDFILKKARITALVMQYPSKEISNRQQARFAVLAFAGEQQVAIEPPLWQVSYPDSVRYSTAQFSMETNGLLVPEQDALDAGLAITAIDTADNSGLSVTEEGFSLFAKLSRQNFQYTNMELKDHSGMLLVIDSTDIAADVGARITLKRPFVPRSKAVSAATISTGNSFLFGGFDNLESPVDLYLPIPTGLGLADFREARIGRWDDTSLSWETLEDPNFRISPYNMVHNTINQDGEYIVFARSEKLGIKNLKLLPNPFSPHLANRNDPYNRGRKGQVITFNLTSRDISQPFVTLKIYNMNGELVRVLADRDLMEKGLVALIWDGKTLDNTYARNGRYLMHIKVEDSSGEKEELKSSVLIK